jgi:hypothetical protein
MHLREFSNSACEAGTLTLLYVVEQFTNNTPHSSTDACPLQHNFGARSQIFALPQGLANRSHHHFKARPFRFRGGFRVHQMALQPNNRRNRPGCLGAPSFSE